MDAYDSPVENSKRQHLFQDRLSALPSPILHRIISYLPTKNAVATSVLSTNWRYHWTSAHNLKFCDEITGGNKWVISKKAFAAFVDKVLLLNDVPNIHKFSLKCMEFDLAVLDKWFANAVNRNVQELVFSFMDIPVVLPCYIFHCESLRILKIEFGGSVNVPGSLSLSSVRILHFKFGTIFCDQSTEEISLNCPLLEVLKLYNCEWLGLKTVNIYAPRLQKLTTSDPSRGDSNDCEIKINAEDIVSLKLTTAPYHVYTLCHQSSINDVYLDLSCFDTIPVDTTVLHLGGLLRAIHNVRDLVLTPCSIQTLSFPSFSVHLLSLSRLIHLRVEQGLSISGRQLIDLLYNMPNIESLSFLDGLCSFKFNGIGRILGKPSPYFLSQLKLVDIKHFRGTFNELWFVKFLIESVRVTDKLIIKLTRSQSGPVPEWKESIIGQLSIISKYPNCVLELI